MEGEAVFRRKRKWWRKRRYMIPLVLLVLLTFMATNTQLYKRHQCVEMPNGFLIGRATVFSSLIGWGPDVAMRYPDGRLFLRGDNLLHFWDHETVAGSLPHTNERGYDHYIYHNDLGLIREIEQPKLYRRIFDQKKAELENKSPNWSSHVYYAYANLRKDPANRRDWCPTAWFWP
jgi:hypothetical protein